MFFDTYTSLYNIPYWVYNILGGDKKMENKKCCDKKTHRTENEKKLLNNRLNRIEGQIKGVKKMISEDVYCNDVLVQLSAIENSVKSLSNLMLEKHLYTCIARDLENDKIDTINEIVSLFKRFNKG